MHVGIVGAGVTGLALHHYLDSAGVESVVFEESDEPGGVVRSRRVDGRVVELGPQRTRLTDAFSSLVETLGLDEEVRYARALPLYVLRDGRPRRAPLSVRSAVTTDLLSWRGKLRVLWEPTTGPPRADETVQEVLARKFGAEAATYALAPLYAGLYASDPDEMYARHSLSRALDAHGVTGSLLLTALRRHARRSPPPVVSFDDGLQVLPRALSERHADAVRLETPVTGVREATDGYVLDTPAGETRVDHVVVTTPADVTARLLETVAPRAARAADRLRYNPLAVVHLDARCERAAAGYLVPHVESSYTLGTTWNDHLLDRDGVYTCYLGGAKHPEVVDWSRARLGRVAREEFEAATGTAAQVLSVARFERAMPAYDRSWTALEGFSLPTGVHCPANYRSRAGIPGRLREANHLASSLARLASA